MDAVLCLWEATCFQSMELERPEAICGLESGTRSRIWSTRGGCTCRQEVAFFGLRLAGTEIAFLNQFSSVFSWLQICRHRGDHECWPGGGRERHKRHTRCDDCCRSSGPGRNSERGTTDTAAARSLYARKRDRKSTRLNSSHQLIS